MYSVVCERISGKVWWRKRVVRPKNKDNLRVDANSQIPNAMQKAKIRLSWWREGYLEEEEREERSNEVETKNYERSRRRRVFKGRVQKINCWRFRASRMLGRLCSAYSDVIQSCILRSISHRQIIIVIRSCLARNWQLHKMTTTTWHDMTFVQPLSFSRLSHFFHRIFILSIWPYQLPLCR